LARKPGRKSGVTAAKSTLSPTTAAPAYDLIDDMATVKALVARPGTEQIRRVVGLLR
jgi:hypothetical protein